MEAEDVAAAAAAAAVVVVRLPLVMDWNPRRTCPAYYRRSWSVGALFCGKV